MNSTQWWPNNTIECRDYYDSPIKEFGKNHIFFINECEFIRTLIREYTVNLLVLLIVDTSGKSSRSFIKADPSFNISYGRPNIIRPSEGRMIVKDYKSRFRKVSFLIQLLHCDSKCNAVRCSSQYYTTISRTFLDELFYLWD